MVSQRLSYHFVFPPVRGVRVRYHYCMCASATGCAPLINRCTYTLVHWLLAAVQLTSYLTRLLTLQYDRQKADVRELRTELLKLRSRLKAHDDNHSSSNSEQLLPPPPTSPHAAAGSNGKLQPCHCSRTFAALPSTLCTWLISACVFVSACSSALITASQAASIPLYATGLLNSG